MKKTLTIICLLLLSALVAVGWVRIDELITKTNYPLEYKALVEENAEKYSVPKELIYAVIKCESDFKSDAVSSKGAVGLMQIIPSTYEWLAEKNSDVDINEKLLYNPETNIKYGVYYLDWLYSKYGDWKIVLAAYNAGHGRVDEWIKDGTFTGETEDIPFKETREYVEKVLDAQDVYTRTYFFIAK